MGKVDYDSYARDIVISPHSLIKVKRIPKMDNYPEKRVELHCHTNMSAMDAVTDPVTLINRAAAWGHQAMAITDHGCVQAFPDCMYNMPKNFKVIYGMEAYVVNDLDRPLILKSPDSRSVNDEIIVFDVETTGLNFNSDRLTEIGAVKLKNLQVVDSFNTKVNPGKHIPEKITELTGISDEDVKNAPGEKQALEMFMEFCGDRPGARGSQCQLRYNDDKSGLQAAGDRVQVQLDRYPHPVSGHAPGNGTPQAESGG